MKTAAWQLVLWPCVFATFAKGEEDWIQNVRKLQAGQFMQVCNQVFMSDLPRNSYLMSDFANDVGTFCTQFSTEKSICPNGGFESLQVDFQDAFFRHASQHMGTPMARFPASALARLGDTGYIVSDKTLIELDVMKNDLCVQMQTAFGDSMQIPKQLEDPTSDPFVSATPNPSKNPAPTQMPTTAPRTVRPTSSPGGTDLSGQDSVSQQQNDLNPPEHNYRPIQTQQADTTLSVGAIIGIAVAVAAVICCFFYFEARRRNLARQVGILSAAAANNKSNRSGKGKSTLDIETAKPPLTKPSSSRLSRKPSARPTKRASKPASAAIEEIQDAINNADWDNIYRLASLLAEEDEAQSLPGLNLPKGIRRRSHLNAEDQERTKTLDDLMSKGDWTGLAVTAALYAGESGSSHQHATVTSSINKKTHKSLHHDDDWEKTHVVSLDDNSHSSSPSTLSGASFEGRDIEQGHASVHGLVHNLNAALNAGDWAQVNQLAIKIKEQKGASGGSSFVSDDVPDTQAMVLTSGSSRIGSHMSSETHDTDMSRKQTIEKLMRAEKWKGVSIMANLYEMESKQTMSSIIKATSSGARSSGRPPRTRKSGRTKELRHSDRVDENIVGFRQEDDAVVPYGSR